MMHRQLRPSSDRFMPGRDGSQFPSKQHNPSQQFRQNMQKIRRLTELPASQRQLRLVSNAYSLVATGKVSEIFEYDLAVTTSFGCKDLPPKVLNRTFVSRSIRKLITNDLLPTLTGRDELNGSVLIGSNLDTIYASSLFKLNSDCSQEVNLLADQEFKFNNLPVTTDLISNLYVDVVIKFSKSFTLDPSNYSGHLLSTILHHELSIKMLRYGPVYYVLDESRARARERLDLLAQHLLGFSISGAKRCSNDMSCVVINCSHAYITQPHRLIDLLACFIANRPVDLVKLVHSVDEAPESLKRFQLPSLCNLKVSDESFASFCSILSGFKCYAIHDRDRQVNLRFTLTEQSACDLLLEDGLTVQEFYRHKGINLNYPNLSCLKSRLDKHPYFPLEMCSLLSGQKVPIFRLSAAARSHLTSVSKPKPVISKNFSSNARDNVARICKPQCDSFGIKLSETPVEATGLALAKPFLQYRNQVLGPQRDFWESGVFYATVDLVDNWCVVDTVGLELNMLRNFFEQFALHGNNFGLQIGKPTWLNYSKDYILEQRDRMRELMEDCSRRTERPLRFVMFIIDSSSTTLNRLIHLSFDDHPNASATCLRAESVLNQRQHRAIFRTLLHKLNTRLGGTNVTYNSQVWSSLDLSDNQLMIVGLDVTHPDNELNGVSIVGCAYTYCKDLFRHKSLVWPQAARLEIIFKMDALVMRLLEDYANENSGRFPQHIIVYRDGVSHEEFDRVRSVEIAKAQAAIEQSAARTRQMRPNLSYIIAQKRHTVRFFDVSLQNNVLNPPGGTLISRDLVVHNDAEFYLYSNTSPQATARPIHYHILLDALGLEKLQKLTYYLCFNFGKCSSSLSMPSSLRYAHNAAYDARNRVIASKEFHENKFYTTKFFC